MATERNSSRHTRVRLPALAPHDAIHSIAPANSVYGVPERPVS